jgi:hypothetical protein
LFEPLGNTAEQLANRRLRPKPVVEGVTVILRTLLHPGFQHAKQAKFRTAWRCGLLKSSMRGIAPSSGYGRSSHS